MRVLVIGASGMLGFAIHRVLHDYGYCVTGTLRASQPPESSWCRGLRYRCDTDVEDFASVLAAIRESQADVVINAAGVIKQLEAANDHRKLIAVNAVFPRLLASAADEGGFRVIQFSTDCVFSGKKGNYRENDVPDAQDLYGMSKFLGEPNGRNTLVLRTSIIGRGLVPNSSLLDWSLRQEGRVKGFSRAIFSGLPVNEIGQVLAGKILPRLADLVGLYHLSAGPISKLELLRLVQLQWSKGNVEIVADDEVRIDRSLDSTALRERIDYRPEPWPKLVSDMFAFYEQLSR